jgi:class 3 adenylate cyclase/tetratricopeptide (TPR) repeat protein
LAGIEGPPYTRFVLVRKTVTVLFCDVAGSTRLGELDPEAHRRVMSRFFEEMSAALERHGGTVEKFIGDAVMAVFGVPTVREDDALRAVRAATEMRDRLDLLNRELEADFGIDLEMRIGVNTGEVVAGDGASGHALVTGDAVVVAKRLEEAAPPGQILIGKATYPLVKDAVEAGPLQRFRAKGKKAGVDSRRLDEVGADRPGVERKLDLPLVDRRTELARLRAAFDAVAADRRLQLVTVLGQAGIGKSRLGDALLRQVGGQATVLVGRCPAYGEGITYWPLRGIVRSATDDLTPEGIARLLDGSADTGRVAERIAATIGVVERPGATEETFWAVRRFIEQLAAERPLVVAIDELQWAEPTFVDLLDYLVGWAVQAPVLILCLARFDLQERYPAWSSVRANADVMLLEPLSAGHAEQLVEAAAAGENIDTVLRRRIAETAEGNPLFAEQLVAAARESPPTPAGELPLPPSIDALLAARLDGLEPAERSIVERASVMGREFSRAAVVELSPSDERSDVGRFLMTLVRKELIQPYRSMFAHDDGFRFRHDLIRDAAYRRLPKDERARLHERQAGWLELDADHATELEELIAYHLESALRYRRELGRRDETTDALALRAGERLAAAGRRALRGRGDLSAGINLLTRATTVLPEGDPTRRRILPELGSALMRAGDFDRAESVLTAALEAASAVGDRRLELRALIDREFFRQFTKPEGSVDEMLGLVDEVIPLLEELDDDLGLAKAWWLKSEADVRACRWGARAQALERALQHARRAGDAREEATIVSLLDQALYYGPTPVPEAIRRCQGFLEQASDDRAVLAAMECSLGGLRAMQGDFAEARRLWSEAEAIFADLGLRVRRAIRSIVGAEIESLAGNVDGAVGILRAGYDAAAEMQARSISGTVAAFLAEALCEQGDYAEAERFSTVTEREAASDDLVTQVLWRSSRARVLAERGEDIPADDLAKEAVRLAEPTDFPDLQARALLAHAAVLAAGGQRAESTALRRRAGRLYEDKGNVVAARRAAAGPLVRG